MNLFCYSLERDIELEKKANPEVNKQCYRCNYLHICQADLSYVVDNAVGSVSDEEADNDGVSSDLEGIEQEVSELFEEKKVVEKKKNKGKKKKESLSDLADMGEDELF